MSMVQVQCPKGDEDWQSHPGCSVVCSLFVWWWVDSTAAIALSDSVAEDQETFCRGVLEKKHGHRSATAMVWSSPVSMSQSWYGSIGWHLDHLGDD